MNANEGDGTKLEMWLQGTVAIVLRLSVREDDGSRRGIELELAPEEARVLGEKLVEFATEFSS